MLYPWAHSGSGLDPAEPVTRNEPGIFASCSVGREEQMSRRSPADMPELTIFFRSAVNVAENPQNGNRREVFHPMRSLRWTSPGLADGE